MALSADEEYEHEKASLDSTRTGKEVSPEHQEASVEDESLHPTCPTPYDWPSSRKITIGLTVSLAQLVGTSAGSFLAPALGKIAASTHMDSTTAQISFTIYMLGLGFAPFFVGPASEVFGRTPVWLTGATFFAVCNALCPVGESKVVLIIFRFLSGIGASSGVVLTGPILADMFHKEQRGISIAIGTVLPYLGPALGPLIGGVMSQHASWPWLFWVLSIAEAAVILLGFLVIRETYAPVLERQRQQQQLKAQQKHGTNEPQVEDLATETTTLFTKTRHRFALPARMLLRRPTIQLLSLLNGLSFGIYVLVLSIYATLFTTHYHETPTISSLHYISIALGAIVACQLGGRAMDAIYSRLTQRSGQEDGGGQPEFRIPLLAIGAVLNLIGLLWLGWAAQGHAPWILVDIGAFIYTAGSFLFSQGALAYILDEFALDAASANGAVRILSYLLAFALPLPAPAMYEKLGYGWGNTLLALIWVVLAFPSVVALWFWGPRIRAIGREK